MVPFGDHTEAELLARAAALEARSTHPLARAVLRYVETKGIALAPALDVQVLKGKGLIGTFDGKPLWLGSHRYVIERGQDTPEVARQAETLEADGKTVLVVGNARHVCGVAGIGRSATEAEDLTQEALMAIHTRRHTYDPSLPLMPWVHAIARYKLIDHLRIG